MNCKDEKSLFEKDKRYLKQRGKTIKHSYLNQLIVHTSRLQNLRVQFFVVPSTHSTEDVKRYRTYRFCSTSLANYR